jgi:polyhydroxyalkanoate synthesis regulator phasin
MKKKVIAGVAAAAIALSVGGASVASAHGGLGGKGAGLSTLLSDLVTKGTITQSQADAIVKAQTDAQALAEANRPTEAEMQAHRTAEIAVITSTLGITEATLTSRLQAGESLATIAGTKKDALIAALVAFENKEIDARVTAGKLTSAQATTLKANTTAMVTDKVNSVKGFGKKGHGKGPRGGADAGVGGGLVVPGTGTTSTAKYTSGLTIKA